MKLFFLILFFVISLVLQLFFMESWQVAGTTANIVLAFLVVSCLFNSAERMLWLGFIAGLILYFYASTDFGLNLGFYILLVLVCKYILKLGETELSWWKAATVVAAAAFIQALLLKLPGILSVGMGPSTFSSIFSYAIFSFITAGIWYVILTPVYEFSEKINLNGIIKR